MIETGPNGPVFLGALEAKLGRAVKPQKPERKPGGMKKFGNCHAAIRSADSPTRQTTRARQAGRKKREKGGVRED